MPTFAELEREGQAECFLLLFHDNRYYQFLSQGDSLPIGWCHPHELHDYLQRYFASQRELRQQRRAVENLAWEYRVGISDEELEKARSINLSFKL